MSEKNPLSVGFLGFEGLMALDLVGPIDAFTSAFVEDRNGELSNCYEVVIIGLSGRLFTSESGVVFKPHKTIKNAPPLDTLIIPGGKGLRVFETQKKAAMWIASRAATTRRIATVCTGTFGLAATGMLKGRCVTTHWRQAQELAGTIVTSKSCERMRLAPSSGKRQAARDLSGAFRLRRFIETRKRASSAFCEIFVNSLNSLLPISCAAPHNARRIPQ